MDRKTLDTIKDVLRQYSNGLSHDEFADLADEVHRAWHESESPVGLLNSVRNIIRNNPNYDIQSIDVEDFVFDVSNQLLKQESRTMKDKMKKLMDFVCEENYSDAEELLEEIVEEKLSERITQKAGEFIGEESKDKNREFWIKCPSCGKRIKSKKGNAVPTEGTKCPECETKMKYENSDD